jgi:hypothetical protein
LRYDADGTPACLKKPWPFAGVFLSHVPSPEIQNALEIDPMNPTLYPSETKRLLVTSS